MTSGSMRARFVVVGDDAGTVFEPGEVAWEDDRIAYVGPPRQGATERVIDLGEGVVAPGFVNGHTHAAMSLMRGLADDHRLMEWLNDHVWPIEAHLTPDDIRAGTLLAAAEMIRAGIVAYADMYMEGAAMAEAARVSGLRAAIGWGITGDAESGRDRLLEAADLADELNRAGGPVTGWLAPHAPYTCTPELLRDVADVAARRSLPIHIHLSESEEEMRDIRERYGLSPIALAGREGILGPRTLAAHSVYLSDEDIAMLADTRTGVIHCPASNLKLGNGVARVPDLLAAGVAVGLGSDGAASTNSLEMFQEMRLASWLQKSQHGDPASFTARQALALATHGGARVLGLTSGVLEAGRPADLIGLNWWGAHVRPVLDPISSLVYASHPDDVRYTVVAGRILLDDGVITSFDEQAVLREAEERTAMLLGRAGR